MIMIIPLIPLLGTLLPMAGQLIGGMIKRGQSRRDIAEQNEYNNPANQLARLRKAGLPYAAFTGGQAGSQSGTPETTDYGFNEAGGNAIGNFITTAQQIIQGQILKAQERSARADADIKEDERDWKLEKWFNTDAGRIQTNQQAMLDQQKTQLEADTWIKGHQKTISEIDMKVKNELYNDGSLTKETRERINFLLEQIGGQQINSKERKHDFEYREKLLNKLEQGKIPDLSGLIYGYMFGGMKLPSVSLPGIPGM